MWCSMQLLLTPVTQLLMTQVQMEMSEILSQHRLHQSITLIEGDASTYSVAEYAIKEGEG